MLNGMKILKFFLYDQWMLKYLDIIYVCFRRSD